MFIAIDGTSKDLPEDIKALSATSNVAPGRIINEAVGMGTAAETVPLQPESGAVLDRWDVQSHQYTTKADVDASILGRLFSGSGKVSSHGVVQEAKRFCVRTTDKDKKVEYGTAVRLSVVVLSTEFNASLTLPNIAATAQLTDIRARIALSVDGYSGPLGDLLPAPDDLNVENLAVYTTAFKQIQARVFGVDGQNYIAPTLLGYYKT